MIKQARELGIKATFAFGDGACTDEMAKLAGAAAEGLICSQAGIPTQMASARSSRTRSRPSTARSSSTRRSSTTRANLLIAAMQKADSADPAKYLPELQKISYDGATGKIEFDEKGDRKDAEMTIFQLKDGKVEPIGDHQGRQDDQDRRRAGGGAGRPRPRRRHPRRRRRLRRRRRRRRSNRLDRQRNGAPPGRRFFAARRTRACRRRRTPDNRRRERRSPNRGPSHRSRTPDRSRSSTAWTSSCSS